MDKLPTTSGIYVITCTANGKIYVGSAVNLRKRWAEHLTDLKHGVHHNSHLQNAFLKYGADEFSITVIEFCERDMVLVREQHYLDTLKPFNQNGFNVNTQANSTFLGRVLSKEHKAKIGAKSAGRIVSKETRMKMSSAQLGRTLSEEHRQKLRLSKSNISPETRAKMSSAAKSRPPQKLSQAHYLRLGTQLAKQYTATDPNGEQLSITNLTLFCRENNLNVSKMTMVAQGNRPHHKGWKCEYAE